MNDHPDEASPSQAIADFEPTTVTLGYEARRCAICGGRNAHFGFVPPILPKGELWACAAHRAEIEHRLRGPAGASIDAGRRSDLLP